jgi:hypothetical protein
MKVIWFQNIFLVFNFSYSEIAGCIYFMMENYIWYFFEAFVI